VSLNWLEEAITPMKKIQLPDFGDFEIFSVNSPLFSTVFFVFSCLIYNFEAKFCAFSDFVSFKPDKTLQHYPNGDWDQLSVRLQFAPGVHINLERSPADIWQH
jgi:hypothetical protein